jgi:hypothetical protein
MPATREMSPITHRQIRRWLYNPVYDAEVKIRVLPIRRYNIIPSVKASHPVQTVSSSIPDEK